MSELLKFGGITLIALIAVVTFRVIKDLLLHGEGRVREVREAGGGVVQKLRGELIDQDRSASSSRAHGLYISVEDDGTVKYQPKSMIAREVA